MTGFVICVKSEFLLSIGREKEYAGRFDLTQNFLQQFSIYEILFTNKCLLEQQKTN